MNFEKEHSDPDALYPTHVPATTSSGDPNSTTPKENRKSKRDHGTVSWKRTGNADGKGERTKGSNMDMGCIGQLFSTDQHQNCEHDEHPHFEDNDGIFDHPMEPQVADSDVARGRRQMPDAQGSVITVLHSHYIEGSEGKEFCEQTKKNLSSTNTSSKSYRLKRVQTETGHIGDSATSPNVSMRSIKLKALKHHSTQHPKTHAVEKEGKSEMFKSESHVIRNEHSDSERHSYFPQHNTLSFKKHQNPPHVSSKSDSSNSVSRETNRTENSVTKSYACDQCGKRFKVKHQLTRHQGLHSESKSHQCKDCSKLFSTNSAFEIHMRVHSGVKPFECEVCKATFARKGNLQQHRIIHSGRKPFSCEICNRGFSLLGSLKRHTRIHTEEKPYTCEICTRKFSDASALRTHTRIHTEEKPYSCEICMRMFSDASSLRRHRRIHTEEKPYMCEMCSRKFSDASNLQRQTYP